MKPVLCLDFYVELNIPICRVQSVLQIGENQKSVLFFYPKLWSFENNKNLKPIIMKKWPLKKKHHISTSFKHTFRIAKNT